MAHWPPGRSASYDPLSQAIVRPVMLARPDAMTIGCGAIIITVGGELVGCLLSQGRHLVNYVTTISLATVAMALPFFCCDRRHHCHSSPTTIGGASVVFGWGRMAVASDCDAIAHRISFYPAPNVIVAESVSISSRGTPQAGDVRHLSSPIGRRPSADLITNLHSTWRRPL